MIKAIYDFLHSVIFDGLCGKAISITSCGELNGHFKSVYRGSAGTTTITEGDGEEDAIVLTDLIMTTDKVNAATATVRFTDGTNTVNLMAAQVTDAPCNITIPFRGHWQGWRAARLELVTVGVVKCTVSCGYYKIPKDKALSYNDWDSRR